ASSSRGCGEDLSLKAVAREAARLLLRRHAVIARHAEHVAGVAERDAARGGDHEGPARNVELGHVGTVGGLHSALAPLAAAGDRWVRVRHRADARRAAAAVRVHQASVSEGLTRPPSRTRAGLAHHLVDPAAGHVADRRRIHGPTDGDAELLLLERRAVV